MTIAVAALVAVGALLFTLVVREKDLPVPEPVSPFKHLEEAKARIYDNLRDLQFEYRVGKLSDTDYQRTKLGLQGELAKVLAEFDRIKQETGAAPAPLKKQASPKPAEAKANTCPHCGAAFQQQMKFCGECGKAMNA